MEACIAVSADGRVAVVERYPAATPVSSTVVVGDWGDMWAKVRPSEDGQLMGLRWSPDGSALAYWLMKYDESQKIRLVEAVAMAVPRPARVGSEIVLTRARHWCLDLEWAGRGQRVYLISRPPAVGESVLEAVEWPTLTRRELMRAGSLSGLSVARSTGDVLVMEVRERQSGETADAPPVVVWRLCSDGTVDETAVRLERLPIRAIVSPDGQRLAVVPPAEDSDPRSPRAAGLVVYQLADGTSQRFDASPSTLFNPPPVHWILGGRALLFQESKNRVRLVDLAGDLPEVGPVSVEAPVVPGRHMLGPDLESRRRLGALAKAVCCYLMQHDYTFPDLSDMDAAREALYPYVETADVFVDPRSNQPYGVNSAISRSKYWDVRLDAVVFYETVPGKGGGRSVVLALRGDAAHVTAEEWEELKRALGID